VRDRIAFLADGHLTRDDPARLEVLVRALEELGRTCAAVCVLGDLFEVWLGVRAREPHVARVGEALAGLRAAGVRTVYVAGNRDFAIGRGATAGLFDEVAEEEIVERFGARSYCLAHGDLVNVADRQYRLWRRFAKGLLAPAALALLPDRATLALAARFERGLRATNRRHKMVFPEDACRAWAGSRVGAGADFAVVGHFHREVCLPVTAGGRSGTFLSLPFWHDEPRPVLFDRQGNRVPWRPEPAGRGGA
jgi:UDP-2,3-diacylglucosamine hydrolase